VKEDVTEPGGECVRLNPVAEGMPLDPNGPNFTVPSIGGFPGLLSGDIDVNPITRVCNASGVGAGRTRLKYYYWSCDGTIHPQEIDGDTQDGLGAWACEDERINIGWATSQSSGNYMFAACANAYHQPEQTAGDNCAYYPFTVR